MKILSNIGAFARVEYAPKAVIAGLSELLMQWDAPFISNRYTQLLDIIVTLLQVTSVKKESYFSIEDEPNEEKEYCNLLVMLQNHIKKLDEFSYFRAQIDKIKQANMRLLQQSVATFPQAKRDFFVNILRVQRVENEPRQIYKIRRP